MNNFHINKVVKDTLTSKGVLKESDILLVSSPGVVADARRRVNRYLWNLHVHGSPRVVGEGKDYLLVGLSKRPNIESDVSILHVFRLPVSTQRKTVAYRESSLAMSEFRVEMPAN